MVTETQFSELSFINKAERVLSALARPAPPGIW